MFKNQDERNLFYHQNYELKIISKTEKAIYAEVYLERDNKKMWLPITGKCRQSFTQKGGKTFVKKHLVSWLIEKDKEKNK